jgi:FtsP/CotA-like multicopper oxidase with cupredoxin domain
MHHVTDEHADAKQSRARAEGGFTMISRRDLLKAGALTGASFAVLGKTRIPWAGAAIPGGSLDPAIIPKYVTHLLVPPAMPRSAVAQGGGTDLYRIAMRQFRQQVLPPGFPTTTVWGYGATPGGVLHSPSFTIEATVDRPVRVQWINGLTDSRGRFLPHLLPVDPTLHWANPPGGFDDRDMRPSFTSTPGAYRGPVPMVTHLHGGHTREESDGYAEAWFLPNANDIPSGFATVGSYYDEFREKFADTYGMAWSPGSATFGYLNDQRASTLWFHDHSLGMTRLNVYAGPAGFFLLRGGSSDLPDGVLPGPAPRLGDAPGTRYHEIPIAIQDRAFNRDGSLFYPSSRAFFDGFEGPYIGTDGSDISPIFNPEFFGNTMMVNGHTWPVLDVEPRRYRFRFLNGCNSRFLMLKIASSPTAHRPAKAALSFWQIGTEGGFLPAPLEIDFLLMGLAERADTIVDFTGLRPGTELYLINEAPDEPYGGGRVGHDYEAADPSTTGQILKFRVVPLTSADHTIPPDQLSLPTLTPLGPSSVTRRVSLNEEDSSVLEGVGPKAAFLGTLNAQGNGVPLGWDDPITEHPALDATETWEIHNFTDDAHPIHIHEVMFQVTDREGAERGEPTGPEAWEAGFKDTVIAYPGEVTSVKARFDLPGRFVWHCHIVEHEDNEMMRPYEVG